VGQTPGGYATTRLADEALAFVRSAPSDRPWFLMYTPPAPHAPWLPAPGDEGAFADAPVPHPSQRVLNDVRGKPAWVRALPRINADLAAQLIAERRRERETLLAVDRAIEAITVQVQTRGELDRTLIVFLTDNGLSFGEHRWTGKRCPYEECVRTPLAIRSPWQDAGTIDDLVTNLDLAPTVMDFVESYEPVPIPAFDGASLRPFLDEGASPTVPRAAVLLQYAGDGEVPPWVAVRTRDFKYVEDQDGTVELYDLTGRLGRADPDELDDRSGDPRYDAIRRRLQRTLTSLLAASAPG
jgi:arylsulfatase A-like enzyme